MKYAFVENENIFIAFSKNDIPAGKEYIEVEDWIQIKHLKIDDNGKLRLKTEEEILNEIKQEKLNQLKNYVANLLSQTDWVIIKLQSMKEEGCDDTTIQKEKEKYASVLKQRKMIREWNATIEKMINKAQTIEALEAIKIEILIAKKE